MIKTCQHCGAVNGEPVEICCFCDAPLNPVRHTPISRQVSTTTQESLAVEPEWRREVSSRLHAYRARRPGSAAASFQATLPFDSVLLPPLEDAATDSHSDMDAEIEPEFIPPAPVVRHRKPQAEHFEISINDPASTRSLGNGRGSAPAHSTLLAGGFFQAASLRERRRAALLDMALLFFSYGGMLALFIALGGRLGFNKVDAMVAGATLVLFYAQYCALFTVFGGSTPGMMLRGIRVVSFDGTVPTSRQMGWRSLGYLISAGTCFLGFFWALWDDDHLCWHDRISQTYLMTAESLAAPEAGQDAQPSTANQ